MALEKIEGYATTDIAHNIITIKPKDKIIRFEDEQAPIFEIDTILRDDDGYITLKRDGLLCVEWKRKNK